MNAHIAKSLLVVVMLLTSTAEGDTKAGAGIATPVPEQPICSGSGQDSVKVLVGPFTVAGEVARASDTGVDQILAFAIVGWLTASRNLSATPYKGNFRGFEGRKYSDLSTLLAAPIFYGRTPSLAKDVQGNRRITNLSQALQQAGCDYLFSGHITIEKNTILINSYLLTTKTAELSRKTGSVIRDTSITTSQAAGMLASKLLEVLAPKVSKSTNLEVGCFRFNGTADASLMQFATLLAKKSQDGIIEDLATNPAYQELASPQPTLCSTPEAINQSKATQAIITGEIGFGDDDLTLFPYVRMIRRDKEVHTSVPIRLSPTTVRKNHASEAIRDYIEQVHLFVHAIENIGQGEGVLSDIDQSLSPELLFNALQPDIRQTQASDSDKVLVLGYRALSQQPDDPVSLAVLGAALLQNQKPNFAIYNLKRAIGRLESGSLSMFAGQETPGRSVTYVLARSFELLGQAQSAQGGKREATESLKRAMQIFEKNGLLSDLGRANRALALLRLTDEDRVGAIRQLQTQSNLATDYDSLILLSGIEAAEGHTEAAGNALKKAAPLVNQSDDRARVALGDVYEALGEASIAKGDLDSARQARHLFEDALGERESQKTKYLAGVAAYKSRDFTGASEFFRQVLTQGQGEPTRWTEAAWLNFVECLVLQGKFVEAATQAGKARDSLSGPAFKDSRLVILYIELIARALSPGMKPENSNDVLSQIQKLKSEGSASISKLLWKSNELDSFIKDPRRFLGTRPYAPEGIPMVETAREMLFEDSDLPSSTSRSDPQ